MNPLPPIPTPPRQRWREFRIRFVPFLVFLCSLGGAVIIWDQHVAAPSIQGEAEVLQASVVTPQPGTLTEVLVSRFQKVAKGDPVVVITPADPRTQLSLIQGQLEVLRARFEPDLAKQRTAMDYERLRLDWLLQKVEVAEDRVELARAENELRRSAELFNSKLISDDEYDIVMKTHQQLQVTLQERTNLVADLEQGLSRLHGVRQNEITAAEQAIKAALDLHEQRLQRAEMSLSPITLEAPIDGIVNGVFRQPGENVLDGEIIVAISALHSPSIIGYLRQPFPIEPQVGMAVEVRTRSLQRQVGLSQIIGVGPQLEPITNSLAMAQPGSALDIGLPIAIRTPPNLKIRPGETVDLILQPPQ